MQVMRRELHLGFRNPEIWPFFNPRIVEFRQPNRRDFWKRSNIALVVTATYHFTFKWITG